MKNFMSTDFLLKNDTAIELYHSFAENMPIVDYHCHINPKEIAEDKQFKTITEVWLGGDHYKWRQMRSNGIDEKYITGDATDFEKFEKWAETLEKAIGNPLYHWSHLELQRYFDIYEPLTVKNAKKIYDICNKKLNTPELSVRNIIKKSNVKVICTTDDPIDNLEWHDKIAADSSFDVSVYPAWRPDNAMNIEKRTFCDYIKKLSTASNIEINSFSTLKEAIIKRMDYFNEKGCRVSDHGLNYVMYKPCSAEDANIIFIKRLLGASITYEEELQFKTAFMCFIGREYNKRNWVMQLHYGTKRDNNTLRFNQLGPDTGYDCINTFGPSYELAEFLNSLNTTDELPKTVIYSLNPNDNAAIGTIIGCFQDTSAAGKLQHGSAWWFNDNKTGMIDQMTTLANLGLLSNFIGMLTDSRSFLSYTRHEYFRRILCNMIGTWVEDGEYPNDKKMLEKIIKDISYNNAIEYFNFK